jgi:hypothetical protein
VAQVIQHTHEQHDVEPLMQIRNVIYRKLPELDVEARNLGGKPRLRQIVWVEVHTEHALGSTAFHLERIEAAIAPDIEYAAAGKVGGNRSRKRAPFGGRIVAKEVRRGGFNAVQIEVMEPRAERLDASTDLFRRKRRLHCRTPSRPGAVCSSVSIAGQPTLT